MNPENVQEVLGILSINLQNKDMSVLAAILRAQTEPTDYVGFDRIREELAVIEGGKKGEDPLVYRSLSALASAGYVESTQQGKSHGYRSNVGLIQHATRLMIKEKVVHLQSRIDQISSEIQSIDELNDRRIARMLISFAMGEEKRDGKSKTLFAQGWDEVLDLIDSKVYAEVVEGDIVRITLEWVNQPENVEPLRMKRIESLVKSGASFRALDHRKQDAARLQKYREITERMSRFGTEIGLRISERDDATYQFIARNYDGIMLIVSENPLSATWIPRAANPELVNDAIASFDAEYEIGVDIRQYKGG